MGALTVCTLEDVVLEMAEVLANEGEERVGRVPKKRGYRLLAIASQICGLEINCHTRREDSS